MQHVLLVVRSGDSPGKHIIKLVMESPSGKKTDALVKEVKLTDFPHGGIHIKTQLNISLVASGVYWIDVLIDGRRFTRMPINISIQRLPGPEKPSAKKR